MNSPEIVPSIYLATGAAPCHAWRGDSARLQHCGCLQSPAPPGSEEVLSRAFRIGNFGFKVSGEEKKRKKKKKLIVNLVPAS